MSLLERLAGLELLVVTGKGGVGKSTLVGALGGVFSGLERRVLLLELDPRESLYPLFDIPPSGGEAVRAGPGLYVQNLSPRDVLDELVRERIGVEMLSRRVLASSIYQHFAEAAPGLSELAALGHAMQAAQGEIDLVVLDAPATGHGLSMLAAPRLVAEVVDAGPFAEMSEQLAAFLADPQRMGVMVATTAEEMPVHETLELLGSLDRPAEAVMINALYPEASGGDPEIDLWRQRRQVNDRELARLRDGWAGPTIELPMLPLERGIELCVSLGRLLATGLEAVPVWR